MKAPSLSAIVVLLIPGRGVGAQNPKGATYITDEQVKLATGWCSC